MIAISESYGIYGISEVSEIPKHKNCVSTQCKVADIVEEYVVDHVMQTRRMTKSDMKKPRQEPSFPLPVSNISPEKLDQSDCDFFEFLNFHLETISITCNPRLHVNQLIQLQWIIHHQSVTMIMKNWNNMAWLVSLNQILYMPHQDYLISHLSFLSNVTIVISVGQLHVLQE